MSRSARATVFAAFVLLIAFGFLASALVDMVNAMVASTIFGF